MLVISAYYSIPSKQLPNFYYPNIQRFFKYIQLPIIFFTDSQNYKILKNWAGSNVLFIIQEFESLDIFSEFPEGFWREQIKIDPSNHHHTWQLGALWANKTRFVKQASTIDNTHDWYMWVDAGCIRNDNWQSIISNFGNRYIPENPGVYIQLLYNIPDNKLYFEYPDVYVAGSHILLHKSYIDEYNKCYSKMLKEYQLIKIPLIMDQYIMASMSKHTPFIHSVLYNKLTNVPDEWFFFFALF